MCCNVAPLVNLVHIEVMAQMYSLLLPLAQPLQLPPDILYTLAVQSVTVHLEHMSPFFLGCTQPAENHLVYLFASTDDTRQLFGTVFIAASRVKCNSVLLWPQTG